MEWRLREESSFEEGGEEGEVLRERRRRRRAGSIGWSLMEEGREWRFFLGEGRGERHLGRVLIFHPFSLDCFSKFFVVDFKTKLSVN